MYRKLGQECRIGETGLRIGFLVPFSLIRMYNIAETLSHNIRSGFDQRDDRGANECIYRLKNGNYEF